MAEPTTAQKLEADRNAREEAEIEKALNDIEKLIAEINANPHLEAADKTRLVSELRGLIGGKPGNVQQAIQAIAAKAEKQAADNQHVDAVLDYIGHEYGELDARDWEAIKARSGRIDRDNADAVRRVVTQIMVDDTVPEVMRQDVIDTSVKVLQHQALANSIEKYNRVSEEARILANADQVQANKRLKLISKQPGPMGEAAKDAELLGAAACPEMQKTAEKLSKGEISVEQGDAELKKGNKHHKQRLIANMDFALSVIKPKEKALLQGKSGEEIVADSLKILRSLKDEKGHEVSLNRTERATLNAFYAARTKATMELLADSAVAKELELGHGTPEQRVAKAMAVIEQGRSKPMSGNHRASTLALLNSIVANADEHHVSVSSMVAANDKQQAAFVREVVAETNWGVDTAFRHFGAGFSGMLSGDINEANKSALAVGRGVKNRLEGVIGKEAAQTTGRFVTESLKIGAVAGVAVSTTVQKAGHWADEKVRAAKIKWNIDEAIAHELAGLKAKGWADVTVAGKKAFDLNGNKEHDIEAIKMALEKSGVNLVSFDKDKSGSINGAELTAAMKAAFDVQVAQLKPTSTPNVAAANAPQASRV